jgi:hypothetical protein
MPGIIRYTSFPKPVEGGEWGHSPLLIYSKSRAPCGSHPLGRLLYSLPTRAVWHKKSMPRDGTPVDQHESSSQRRSSPYAQNGTQLDEQETSLPEMALLSIIEHIST